MSGVQGKLSSRVMNMKFMRFSKDGDSEPGSREATPPTDQRSASVNSEGSARAASGFRDSSEWFGASSSTNNNNSGSTKDNSSSSTDNSGNRKKRVVVRKRRAPVTIVADNVSVTQLQQARQAVVPQAGRRTFGADKRKKRTAEEAGASASATSTSTSSSADAPAAEDEDAYELDTMFKQSAKRRKTGANANARGKRKH